MIRGSVPSCLRKQGRLPRHLTVRFAANEVEAYGCQDDDNLSDPTICAASFIWGHSIEQTDECIFPFETIADAHWLHEICLCHDTAVELTQFEERVGDSSLSSDVRADSSSHCLSFRDHHVLRTFPKQFQHLHRIVQEHGTVQNVDDGPTLDIATWFVHGNNQQFCTQPRRLRLDSDFRQWRDHFRRLWHDRLDPDDFDIHIVHPTPPAHHDVPLTELIHVIICQAVPLDSCAILTVTVFDGPIMGIFLAATMCARISTYHSLTADFRMIPHCTLRDCVFQSSDTLLHAQSTAQMYLTTGDMVRVNVAPMPADDGSDDEDDTASLMQTFDNDPLSQDAMRLNQLMPQWERPIPVDAPEADDDDPISTDGSMHSDENDHDLDQLLEVEHGYVSDFPEDHLYRRTSHHREAHLPNDNYDDMLHDAAIIWNRQPGEVVHLHYVHYPLASGRSYITEFMNDRSPDSTDQFILVDVVFYYAAVEHEPLYDRRVRLLPQVMSRFNMLWHNHVSHHCLLENHQCLVFVNGERWPAHIPDIRRFHDGDYVKILLPPSDVNPDTAQLVWQRQRSVNIALTTDDEMCSMTDEEDDFALFQISAEPKWQWPTAPDLETPSILTSAESRRSTLLNCGNLVAPLPHHEFWDQVLEVFHKHSAVEREDEGPILYVHTWFLDHVRFLHCHTSRPVRLTDDPTGWKKQMSDVWMDYYLQDLTIHFDMVNPLPLPSAWEAAPPVHILLQQQRQPHLRSVLLSHIDSSAHMYEWHHQAHVLPAVVVKDDVIRVMRFESRCFPAIVPLQCVLRQGENEIEASIPYACTNGDNLRLLLNDVMVRNVFSSRLVPLEDDHEVDTVNLLQTNTIATHTSASEKDRPILQLDNLIPNKRMMIPCQKILFLRQQLIDLDLCSVRWRNTVVKWHDSTLTQLDQMSDWQQEPPLALHLFTDGSSCRINGQWKGASAVVLVVLTSAGEFFGGYRCFHDSDEEVTAPRSELHAMIGAILWAFELLQQWTSLGFTPDVVFHYDSLLAGHVANGAWGPHSNLDIALPLRALVHWISQCFPDVALGWCHVAAHQGHPWNEAADAVAWACLHQWIVGSSMRYVLDIITFDGQDLCSVEWLWYIEAACQCHPSVPCLVDGQLSVDLATPTMNSPDPAIHPLVRNNDQPVTALEDHAFTLRCVTANVLTLYGVRTAQEEVCSGGFLSARHEALLRMCLSQNYHLVGIQESRSKMHGYYSSDDYHILASAATQRGIGGVQLWVAKKWTHSGGIAKIRADDLKIIHSTTQRLVVRLRCHNLRLVILVAHAPNNVDEDTLRTWWRHCSAAISPGLREWPILALLDANARVGSMTSTSIGSFQAQEENIPGTIWHEWLLQEGLTVPQTFESHHTGEGHTWCHPSGSASARLDYIALSHALAQRGDFSTCLADIDISLHRQDHLAVLLQLPLRLRDAVSAPVKQHTTPLPADFEWKIDVHTHAAQLQDAIKTKFGRGPLPIRQRRPHMRPATWQLVLAKKYHWKRCQSISRTLRLGMLRSLFNAWARHEHANHCEPWLRVSQKALAMHAHHLTLLSGKVTMALRADDKAYYDDLACTTGQAADAGLHGLRRNIKAILPKGRQKRNSRLTCVGPDPDEMADHYCRLEAGIKVPYGDLLDRCFCRQKALIEEAPLTASLDSFPTRNELENLCRKAKNGKAPGLDGLRSEELKLALADSSDLLHFLFFKMWALSSEPLQWKGGIFWSIAKKPNATTIDGLRGIMLLEVLGKTFHALLRQRLLHWTIPFKLTTQFGGYKGQQIAFPSLMLRSFLHHADRRHVSSTILFIDIRSAFHCLLRQIVFGTQDQFPAPLVALLTEEGFDVDVLQRDLSAKADHFRTTTSPLLERMTVDAHCSTWFVSPGLASSSCFETHRGSRPGSPVADIAYNILMSKILHKVEHLLASHPQVQAACAFLQLPIPVITWVDDVAIPLVCLHAPDLVSVSQTILQQVIDLFQDHGLRLNLSAGKTEMIAQHRGTGAAACRRQTFQDDFSQIPVQYFGRSCFVRIVGAYKHLGSMIVASLSVAHDVSCRIAKAAANFRTLAKPLFTNRRIAIHTRLQLLEALVIPMITFGCGHWPLLPHRVYVKLNHMILSWQRTIIGNGFWTSDCKSDWELQAFWKLQPLAIRLCKHRLLFAFQLHSKGPAILWDYLTAGDSPDCKGTWLHALRHALDWYRKFQTADTLNAVPDGPLSAESILSWLRAGGQAVPSRVHDAVQRHILREHIAQMVVTEHSKMKQVLVDAKVDFELAPCEDEVSTLKYACDLCSRQFATPQGLNTHRWVMHRAVSIERQYIHSTTCLACNRCFWTVQRLQQHLRQSRALPDGCLQFLIRHIDPLPEPLELSSDLPGPHAFRVPSVRAQGPLLPPMLPLWERRQTAAEDQWYDFWCQHGFPDDLSSEFQAEVWERLDFLTHDWVGGSDPSEDALLHSWLAYLDTFYAIDDVSGDSAMWALMSWGRSSMYDIISEVASDDPDQALRIERVFLQMVESFPMWELLHQRELLDNNRGRGEPPGPVLALADPCSDVRRFHALEFCLDHLSMQNELLAPFLKLEHRNWPSPRGVPVLRMPDGSLKMIVVHTFSGRRRPGDWHDWMHRLFSTYFEDVELLLLSVDTAIHAEHCNLLSEECLGPLFALARHGCVALMMSGPPCETWSSARFLTPPAGSNLKWPKPLRSATLPWGIDSLSASELRQLLQGSQLMLTNLRLDLTVASTGGGTGMEHPETPEDPSYPSIWRTEVHRQYHMQFPVSTVLHIQQWQFGAETVKPTTLRFLGLPYVARHFWKQRDVSYEKPTKMLQGFDFNAKQFNTASAKEYPEHLCRALATSMLASLSQRWRSERFREVLSSQLGEREMGWVGRVADASGIYRPSQSFCPDYQPALG